MALYSHKDYKDKPFLATAAIGSMLGSGCMNLFIGAGVSKGFGLPEWVVLIARILGKGDDTTFVESLRGKSDKELAKMVDSLDQEASKNQFLKLVHEALYRDVDKNLISQLSKSPLLLSVTALLTGSCRGRIDRVFTYNYDDLIEQYLKLLGHAICRRVSPDDFSTKADVEINHVHGFLPQNWKPNGNPTELVLSEKSYRNRRAGIDEGWSSYVEHCLYSKAGLFIGLSGDDSVILDVLKRAQKNCHRTVDYSGYWLLTPDAYDRNESSIVEVGMCPVRISKEQLPEFVFKVCQDALNV